MKKIRCTQCNSVFGIKNPDVVVRNCPKCKAPFKSQPEADQRSKQTKPNDFMSLLSELDDPNSTGPDADAQMMRGLPDALSMQHDIQRRKRERQSKLIKRILIACVAVTILAAVCYGGANYINNSLNVRTLRSDWQTAKQSIQEQIDSGKYQTAINSAVAFESTLSQSEVKGSVINEIEKELAGLNQQIKKKQDDLYLGITAKMDSARQYRLEGDLGLAQQRLDEAKFELDAAPEKDDRLKAAEVRWTAENFLVLATPIYEYGKREVTEEAILAFAASSNVATVYTQLTKHPELEEQYPDESLIIVLMYHWAQVVSAHELNAASEWEQSIVVLRNARDAVLKRPEIQKKWPTLMIAIDQTLTLTIYDRINTSRAHIQQLVSLEKLPSAVLACKDLVAFVNELEAVMASTNAEDFTNPEARDKATGFKAYAKALITELEWQILGILVDASQIKQEQCDEFLAAYMETDPTQFSGQASSYFTHIDNASKNLDKEMRDLEAIATDPNFQDIGAAITLYRDKWKALSTAAADYTANIGSAKSFDKFVNAAKETLSASNVLGAMLSTIPRPPKKEEAS